MSVTTSTRSGVLLNLLIRSCKQLLRHGAQGPAMSQRRRKLIEETFGWIKLGAGPRWTKLVGRWKLAMQVPIAAAAYNLVRLTKPAA